YRKVIEAPEEGVLTTSLRVLGCKVDSLLRVLWLDRLVQGTRGVPEHLAKRPCVSFPCPRSSDYGPQRFGRRTGVAHRHRAKPIRSQPGSAARARQAGARGL